MCVCLISVGAFFTDVSINTPSLNEDLCEKWNPRCELSAPHTTRLRPTYKSHTDESRPSSDEQSAVFVICQLRALEMTSQRVLNELGPAAVCRPVTPQEKRNKTGKTNAGERVNLPAHHHHHGPILPLSIATESPWSHYRLWPQQSDSPLSLAFLHTVPLLINIFC